MASYSYLIADSDPGGYDGQYTDVATLISAKQSTWVSGDDVTIWIGKYGIGGATTLTPPAGVTVLMQPLATHEHSGTPLATPHLQSWQHSNYLLRIAGSGVTVGGVHAKNTATGSSYGSPVVSFSSGAIVATVERCILVHGSTASTAACIGAASSNASVAGLGAAQKVRGNLCIGGNTGIGTQDWEDVSGAVDNNTIVDAVVGIRLSSGATGFSPRNNTIYGCTNSMYSAGTWGSPAYNAASDVSTTALPGTNNYSSDVTAGDFENVSGNDYHLSASSGLIGQGANLYSSFTTDIDGDEWPSSGAWDIGFDHYAVPASYPTLSAVEAAAYSASSITPRCDIEYP